MTHKLPCAPRDGLSKHSYCPLPLTFQIGAAGWNVVEIPTDGITPLFNDLTKALQVIPSKIKNPPFTLVPMM